MLYKIIAAIDEKSGIGQSQCLPWSFKKDFKHFSEITKQSPPNTKNAIVMGRKTWDSLPNGALAGRDNLVLTSKHADHNCSRETSNLFFFNEFDSIYEFCKGQDYHIVWIIGGSSIYNYYISQSYIDELVITRINAQYECDTYFPTIPLNFSKVRSDTCTDIDRKASTASTAITLSFEYYLNII
jgi:dihydrofolate reductase